MIIGELIRKWFGLEKPHCTNCEVWRDLLEESERERTRLLDKILSMATPPVAKEEIVRTEELKPIIPQRVPWRVKQQMLEQEDRQRAALLKNRVKEIDELEKELGIDDASQVSKTV